MYKMASEIKNVCIWPSSYEACVYNMTWRGGKRRRMQAVEVIHKKCVCMSQKKNLHFCATLNLQGCRGLHILLLEHSRPRYSGVSPWNLGLCTASLLPWPLSKSRYISMTNLSNTLNLHDDILVHITCLAFWT